jgi:hypothetical protein
MNFSTLLVLVAAATAPRVEVSTLSGDEVSGNLTSITAETWTLDVAGKPVDVVGSQVLSTRFFVAGQTAGEKEPLELSLTDGSLLHLKAALANSNEVEAASDITGEVKIPRNFVRSLRFVKAPTSVDDAWKELASRTTRQDMIVVRKNDVLDFVEGVIGEITETQVNVLLDGENIPVKRERVFGLIFYQRQPGKAGSAARVQLLNGDILQARKVSSAEGASLSLTLASGPEISVAADQVKTVDFSSGRLAWIDELTPREKKHEFEVIDVVPDYRVNRDIYGSRLKVGRRAFDRGVCVRSKTLVRYRLDGDFSRFQTWIGIQHGYAGDVTVTISCDGTELFTGDVLPNAEAQRLDLDVSGKYSLEVLVDFGKVKSDIGDHLVLGDARLLK